MPLQIYFANLMHLAKSVSGLLERSKVVSICLKQKTVRF